MDISKDPSPKNIEAEAVPPAWTRESTSQGEPLLTCGAQTGPGRNFLIGVGLVFCILGVLGIFWLFMADLPQTLENALSYLMPAGVILCGFVCFDAALFVRSQYLIGEDAFTARKNSFFQRRRFSIPRQSVVAVWQQYTPPDPAAPSSIPGDWVTHLVWDAVGDGRDVAVFPLDGEHSADEAVWLAGLLGRWSGKPVERSFAPGVKEATAGLLPQLPPVEG